ncbi:hypothetical protein NGI13_22285 [Enterobacter asburiae]|uniref:hypothetical protein n=1 Tax=Enterobacter TaxID=547 RepID=UPI0004DB4813|nr:MULTISPECIES: hypothetical protein [Enterobacter]KFA84185.1 hypothetical protein N037_22210 [Enterobacter sp. EGD-HP1]MEB8258283.1 hypothetical protein [Enterobacter asburiae]
MKEKNINVTRLDTLPVRRPEVLIVTQDQMVRTGLTRLARLACLGCRYAESPAQALARCTPRTLLVVWMVSRHAPLAGTLTALAEARFGHQASWLVLTDTLAGVYAWLALQLGGVTVTTARLSVATLLGLMVGLVWRGGDVPNVSPPALARPLTGRQREILLQMIHCTGSPAAVSLPGLAASTVACHRWRVVNYLRLRNLHELIRHPGLVDELLSLMPPPEWLRPCGSAPRPFRASPDGSDGRGFLVGARAGGDTLCRHQDGCCAYPVDVFGIPAGAGHRCGQDDTLERPEL